MVNAGFGLISAGQVMNPGDYYGLTGSCAENRAVWVWLLAVHDGTVLMYPEDHNHEESKDLFVSV